MTLNVKFQEQDQTFGVGFKENTQTLDIDFDELQIIDNFDSGYAQGYKDGENKGYENGNQEGYEQGYANGFENGVASVPNYLKSVVEGHITEIDDNTIIRVDRHKFRENASLKTFKSTSVGTIRSYAFYMATKLETLIVPNLDILSNYTFYGCTALKNTDFSNATEILQNTLYDCTSLERLDFPKAETIKQTNNFYNCSKLTTFIIRTNTVCTLASKGAFTKTPIASGTGYIYVPSALLSKYKSATNWSVYASQIRAIEDYPEITGG